MSTRICKTVEVVTKHDKICLETDLEEIPKSAVEEILNHMKSEFEKSMYDALKNNLFEKQLYKDNKILHQRCRTWQMVALINAILCCLVAILNIIN